jgi:ABC-type branched-subunit amino acid transport system substrate-binding protein
MRQRYGVLVVVLLLVLAAACSGSSDKASDNGLGGSNTTVPAATTSTCPANHAPLQASEVGVTPDSITVTVLADVDNAARPGLFKGSWNGVKAWGDFMNAQGGLGCRHVIVKTADAHLNGDQAKAAVAQACTDSVAMVGTTALFLSDVSGMNNCKDKAGAATGLPDLAELQTEAVQQCSPVSFAVLPTSSACPYSGSGPRQFKVGYTQYDYYLNNVSKDLHGVFAIPKDVPSTIAASMPIFRAENQMGIKSDFEKGMSGLDDQPKYTPLVQQIKSHNSNYARNGLDYTGTLLERREAAAQGVNDQVKVWDCSLQCYDKRLLAGGSAVEGQYVWLNFLPMEDPKGTNANLDAFLQYDKEPDGFGLQAFLAGLAFTRAVNDTMAAHGNDPNALTRANLLAAIKNMHDFDGGGLVPKVDIGNKTGSTCLVGMQVQGGKFVRIDPKEPGQFDCDLVNGQPKPPLVFTIDPKAEYHG